MTAIARRSLAAWTGGIFLLCGLPLVVAATVLSYNDWTFAREARSTEGRVVTKESRTRGSSRNRSRSKRYEVTYTFTVEGQTFEGRDTLSRDDWERLAARAPVEVFYRPQDPRSSRLPGHDTWFVKTVLAVLGSICTVVGGRLLVRSFFISHATRPDSDLNSSRTL